MLKVIKKINCYLQSVDNIVDKVEFHKKFQQLIKKSLINKHNLLWITQKNNSG